MINKPYYHYPSYCDRPKPDAPPPPKKMDNDDWMEELQKDNEWLRDCLLRAANLMVDCLCDLAFEDSDERLKTELSRFVMAHGEESENT